MVLFVLLILLRALLAQLLLLLLMLWLSLWPGQRSVLAGRVLRLLLLVVAAVVRRRCRHFDDDVCRLPDDVGLEALLRVSRVRHGAQESVRIDDRVASLDHIAVAHLLAVLVVRELVVLDVEAELVRGAELQRQKRAAINVIRLSNANESERISLTFRLDGPIVPSTT